MNPFYCSIRSIARVISRGSRPSVFMTTRALHNLTEGSFDPTNLLTGCTCFYRVEANAMMEVVVSELMIRKPGSLQLFKHIAACLLEVGSPTGTPYCTVQANVPSFFAL